MGAQLKFRDGLHVVCIYSARIATTAETTSAATRLQMPNPINTPITASSQYVTWPTTSERATMRYASSRSARTRGTVRNELNTRQTDSARITHTTCGA